MTWFANLHASLFHSIYRFLRNQAGCTRLEALVKAYTLYAEQGDATCRALPLDLTRAWMLVRFVDAGVLDIARCGDCGAAFTATRCAGIRVRRLPAAGACRQARGRDVAARGAGTRHARLHDGSPSRAVAAAKRRGRFIGRMVCDLAGRGRPRQGTRSAAHDAGRHLASAGAARSSDGEGCAHPVRIEPAS